MHEAWPVELKGKQGPKQSSSLPQWACIHATLSNVPTRTDSPIGDSRSLLLTSLGITNLPPNNSCVICGMGPLPCLCHSAEQVILAPRAVNSLSDPIEPLPHPCLVTVTVADLRFLFLLPKITLVAREGAGIPGSLQSGGGESLGGSPPGSPAGCTGTRVAHLRSCTTCQTLAL